ncbi:hypothetical protein EMWEY_00055560 [Eimeria maxima]|uniref:Uncharacterized protein n=1 Tax=Eimeria maxima TaxID=5804 RepID=U6M4Z9_EIMMA|nr:hypothetical protein EMWEY_00055560 [Eimeria maxima]CDJ59086.1 hypothetical protein EMWEY_00055560 [Eimeria maxima]
MGACATWKREGVVRAFMTVEGTAFCLLLAWNRRAGFLAYIRVAEDRARAYRALAENSYNVLHEGWNASEESVERYEWTLGFRMLSNCIVIMMFAECLGQSACVSEVTQAFISAPGALEAGLQ